MPENNFNNTKENDLPKMNNESLPNNNFNSGSSPQPEKPTPLIEIPKEYYEKLAKEEQEKQIASATAEQKRQEAAEESRKAGRMLSLSLLNGLLVFGLLYLTFNSLNFIIIGIPLFIIILTIINAKKDKLETQYPVSLMVGGIIAAVASYVTGMFREQELNLWTYYSIASATVGFLGMIAANIITKIVCDYKNIKALQFIGYFLYFIIIIGAPIYLSITYREQFYKLIFNEQVEVKAETESEFILKTLKARYNVPFTCDNDKVKNQLNQSHQRMTERICSDEKSNKFVVKSIAYNEGSKQYIIIDDYLDSLFIYDTKKNIANELAAISSAKSVEVLLYPEKNCTFYGDCTDCDEYFDRYNKENDPKNQFNESTKLNFEKHLNTDAKTVINSEKFKYVINITGQYSSTADFTPIIENLLDRLNTLGYKNTYGYIITISNFVPSNLGDTSAVVYKATGDTNEKQTFSNPEVQDISASKTNK